VDSIYQRNAVPGAIIDQTPKAGNKVKQGRSIYITIIQEPHSRYLSQGWLTIQPVRR